MVRGATVYVTFVMFLLLARSFAHAAGVDVTSLALDPANPSTLYAGTTGRGVLKSTNGGATWSLTGLTGTPIASLAIDPLVPTTLYAVTPVGVLKSVDGAQSWIGTLLLNEHFSGFLYGFFNPAFATFGSLAIAPRADPAVPPVLYAGFSFVTWDAFTEYVWAEVVWTTDGSSGWGPLNPYYGDPWSFPAWRSAPALAIAPRTASTSATVYTTGSAEYDVCWVRDEGATIGCAVLGQAFVGASALAIDPGNANIVYAGTNGSGVYKTTNGGATWSGGGAGVVKSLAIDTQAPSIIYAGTDDLGVLKSSDGGASWIPVTTGLPSSSIRVVAIDPLATATVYAGTATGVFKSTDGGGTWSRMTSP
jgi:hypothetical protein